MATDWHGNPDRTIAIIKQSPDGPLEPRPAGFILVDGTPLAHSSNPLLASGIPGILLDAEQGRWLPEGLEVCMDGATGQLTTDAAGHTPPQILPPAPAVCATRDHVPVHLRVSAHHRKAIELAVRNGASAIGLVRSEYLEPDNGQIPDAAYYLDVFRTLCEAATGLPVTIRLFDVATSKRPAWLPLPASELGVLGCQGVRLYYNEPVRSIFHAQVRAISDLANEFELRIMLPYVADLAELQTIREEITGILAHPVPIGAIAETPLATLQLRDWLEVADYVAIGCNDLMQCLYGADRDQPKLAHYFDPYAPMLYRFMTQVADPVKPQLDAVQLCGVLPQLPGILPVLLGLGYRAFSVEASMVPYLSQTIADTDSVHAQHLAAKVCNARTSQEVRALLE